MIRLMAVDLDGTLLTTQKEIRETTLTMLTEAARRGCMIVPCTGRPYSRVPEVVRNLPFVQYIITTNGTKIYDVRSDEILYRREIEVDVAAQVLAYAKRISAAVACYQNGEVMVDEVYVKRAWDIFSYERDAREISQREPIRDFELWIRENGMPLEAIRLFLDDADQVGQEYERIIEAFPMCAVERFHEKFIDLNALDVSKGAALMYLCDHLGIDRKECMALGDSDNDISMLSMAGIGVAMGNATEKLKQVADWVTDHNDSDGVAAAIERYVLQD